VFYGTGNPSTWNPAQRPGDNKWTMSIWSRDVDTGKVNWVYQMTPYDEWDFDGINEMILADINVKGKPTKALVHFDRNGFAYTMDRTNRRTAGGREVRPEGELGHPRRHEHRPSAGGQVLHPSER
jgi:glucose dehydrogenase